MGKVTPIFKGKGSPEQCCKYRPMSVTSHVSKLMEKAVLYQLNEYVLSRDFIICHQSAFRKNHSPTTATQKVVCDILEGLNENEVQNVTALCFIDLQKCFDTIDHSIFIRKLQLYGIKDVTLDCFCNYLKDRSYTMCWNKCWKFIVFKCFNGFTTGFIIRTNFISTVPWWLTQQYI